MRKPCRLTPAFCRVNETPVRPSTYPTGRRHSNRKLKFRVEGTPALPEQGNRGNLRLWQENIFAAYATCRNTAAGAINTAGCARASTKSGCAKMASTIALPAGKPAKWKLSILKKIDRMGQRFGNWVSLVIG